MEVPMLSMLMPLLITASQSIYGWNAAYAGSRVPEMQDGAIARLDEIAKEKCKDATPEYLSHPEYSHNYTGVYYVDHAYAYITCRRIP